MSKEDDLRAEAAAALAKLFAFWIRQKMDEDPDHSGPEDQADAFAERVVTDAIARLEASDPRDILGAG
jgi:hypothetical protein